MSTNALPPASEAPRALRGLEAHWARARAAVGRRLARYLPSESQHVFGLTIVIGVLCGLAAVGFHLSIRFAERQLIDRAMSVAGYAWIGWTLLTPAAGGLVAGVLLQYVVPRARGSGVPQVKEAYAVKGVRLRLRDAVGKFVIGALQIGSGAALGREGPTVQICAGVASALGRVTKLPERSRRRLIPVGVAAGIAAAFNAPIAAVTFTIEEIVGTLDQTVLSGVVVAAALAAAIERSILGTHPVIESTQPYRLEHASSLLFYALLGLAGARLSVVFTDSLLWLRERFKRTTALPKWAQPALGGLVTGGLAVVAFGVLKSRGVTGGGYETLSQALVGKLGFQVLLALCAMKLVATVASYSSGGAGGIFAPALFIGAMLGGVVGYVDMTVLGHDSSTLGAFALVGMGAVFAGIIRAPMTSVLIIFEMTGGYGLVLPLMIANVISYGLARHWRPVPIYEALLEQDGIHLPKHLGTVTHALEKLRVESAMTKTPLSLKATMSVAEAVEQMTARSFSTFPLLDATGGFVCLVSSIGLREANAAGGAGRVLQEFAGPGQTIASDEPLIRAVVQMDQTKVRQLAVVDPIDPKRLVGIITMSDVLRAHARAATDTSEPVMRTVRVKDLMTTERVVVTFERQTPAEEMLKRVAEASSQDVFPVLDGGKQLVGLVGAQVIRVLATERKDARWALAADVMQPAAAVQSEDDLRKVTELIVTHGLREIPVVDSENHVIGLLNERDVARVHLKG